jgi:hypothetical protein
LVRFGFRMWDIDLEMIFATKNSNKLKKPGFGRKN